MFDLALTMVDGFLEIRADNGLLPHLGIKQCHGLLEVSDIDSSITLARHFAQPLHHIQQGPGVSYCL